MTLPIRFTLAVLLVLPTAAVAQDHWIASWGAAQQIPEPNNALPDKALTDATLRQTIHLSLGGAKLRVRFSNAFGTAPLEIDAAHLAKPAASGSAKVVSGSDVDLTFGGRTAVIIPAGAEYYSDPVSFDAPDGSDLTISVHFPKSPAQQTGHPGSRATSFVVPGNHVADDDLPGGATIEHWYQIADVEVEAPASAQTVVAIGDSITDGHGSTTNGNDRWPDLLAARLKGRGVALINTGIGGNRVLDDGLGPNLLARFDRDVIARAGVRAAILLEGVNDIGTFTREHPVPKAALDAQRERITAGFQQLIDRAHAHGIKLYGATIMPFVGSDYYHPDAAVDTDRQAINDWIRAPGHFDGVVDFDAVTRDPANPDRLLPAYNSGDHLHPSPKGYAAMAAAVPLAWFGANKAANANGPAIAITFDDLPVHGPLPAGETRIGIMAAISAALKVAHVPPTYGFTNGGFAENEPASKPALAAWRAAGNVLANHSWSHMNLNEHSAAEWEADVLRDEPVIAPLMKDADWHWLRFPFLAEGDTPAKRAKVRKFLGKHGYKVASVTMSFGDYGWNEPYGRCVARHDTAAIAGLEASYLKAAADSLAYARAASKRLYGRDIPYVLLMHVGAFDARMLPRLLDLYRASGVRFVSLDQAERAPFYRGDMDPSSGGAPATLEAAAAAKRVTLPSAPAMPADLATLCQ